MSNKVIFLFCIYMGLERSSLVDLKINMIKDNKIIFGSRKIPLPRQLCDLISQLILENSRKKIRGIHLFYSKYDGKFSPMKENTVNYVFNSSLKALYEKVNLAQGTRARRKHPFEKFLM